MDWFQGSIGEAIQTAKVQKALFVVVVHGEDLDESSQKFLQTIEDPDISSKLKKPNAVCIKIKNLTQVCNQFSQLYPVILVPSIYFINSETGTNIETTGGSSDKDKILSSINKAFEGIGRPVEESVTSVASVTSPRNESVEPIEESVNSVTSPRNERVEQARQIIQNDVVQGSSSEDPSTPTTSMSLEERVERAKKLLAEKQAQKSKETQDKEKNSELERRELGKNIQEMKEKHKEDEFRQAAEERRKAKEEDRIALQKVKEQIAQDRAEKADRFNREKAERDEKRKELEREKLVEDARKAEELLRERSTVARIQFRLPTGVTQNHKFSPEDTIDDLYTFVMNEMTTPYGSNLSLSTTFPSRELDKEPKTKSLRDAGLVPSTTILILPKNRALASTGDNGIMDYVWLLLTPITILWNMINSFFSGHQPQSADNQSRKRQAGNNQGPQPTEPKRRTGGIRTEGNIARLSAEDSDDENNTWNGNSTQQM